MFEKSLLKETKEYYRREAAELHCGNTCQAFISKVNRIKNNKYQIILVQLCRTERYPLPNVCYLDSSMSPKHAVDKWWWLLGQQQVGPNIKYLS